MATDHTHVKAYLVGGGIASLSAAAFLIKDGGIPGKNIFIYEEQDRAGGSVEAQGTPENGYIMHGGRMFEETYSSTYELLSFIPSLADSTRTAKQEILEFHQDFIWNGKGRLVEAGKPVDVSSMGFSARDRLDLTELFAVPEDLIGKKSIDDWFKPAFFKTNFWYMWATTFAFEPWHSAIEFKRYLARYVHLFSAEEKIPGVYRTQYNQYDTIIRPVVRWLAERGVNFEMGCKVTDLDFKTHDKERTVQRIRYNQDGKHLDVEVTEHDLVFVTNGSMSADISVGGMDRAPLLRSTRGSNAWALWEKLSKKFDNFGNPATFNSNTYQTKWESFTVTSTSPRFFDLLEKFSGHEAGEGGLVTIKDSNWLLTLVLNHQPHFYEQPDDVWVWWGYGLMPDKEGNFIHKKMTDCSGREILTEVMSHFRFMAEIPEVVDKSICLPCLMPYIGSQFMPRERGDRPLVIPKGSTNLAFIGQFCEMPREVVFTLEYSVRSAQTAVYNLLKIDKEIAPIKNPQDIGLLFSAVRGMNKGPKRIEPEHRA